MTTWSPTTVPPDWPKRRLRLLMARAEIEALIRADDPEPGAIAHVQDRIEKAIGELPNPASALSRLPPQGARVAASGGITGRHAGAGLVVWVSMQGDDRMVGALRLHSPEPDPSRLMRATVEDAELATAVAVIRYLLPGAL